MDQGVAVAITIGDDYGGMLRITCGVVEDVPATPEVYRRILDQNGELHYGRLFVVANDDRNVVAVIMQEIIPLNLLSLDYRPALDYFLSLVGTITLQSSLFSEDLLRSFGGSRWRDGGIIPYIT
jgi:hypothetical protein